jgi:hypothetical protein
MPTHVALLRGISVGGRNRVAMADLREVVLGLGHTEVAAYIQSGNVVLTSEDSARPCGAGGVSQDQFAGAPPYRAHGIRRLQEERIKLAGSVPAALRH